MRVFFDTKINKKMMCFDKAEQIIQAYTPSDVGLAFAQMEKQRQQGRWLAGYATYELGYVLEPCLQAYLPSNRRLPLLCFGVYSQPSAYDLPNSCPASLDPFVPQWDFSCYDTAFKAVHAHICAGDIYQTNLTFPLESTTKSDPLSLYAALQHYQKVAHGALVLQDPLPAILSRSPELFFRHDTQGNIFCAPMKGTQPRSSHPIRDQQQKHFLQKDTKNRAENLMIVDLLRNDLSRISQRGSVQVPRLFTIESYATVHQMVSHIQAKLQPDRTILDIFQALFPCGSITGAPKIRAIEILRAIEDTPREIYCGGIGWFSPDGAASFNVAIRTLLLEQGRVTLNAGGGIVYDSISKAEYKEALWKTRFATLPQKI